MTFIESTNFFVRTIAFDFINANKDINLQFRLVPMIHVGSSDFYNTVFTILNECDEILYEGANIPGIKTYSKIRKLVAKQLNLVTQRESFNYKALRHKMVHADMDIESGRQATRQLSFWELMKYRLISPAEYFIYSRGLTRARLAKHFMTGAHEAYLAYGPVEDEYGTLRNMVMNQREQIVFKLIDKSLAQDADTNKLIGIMYGEGHMNTIARYLIDDLGYVPRNGQFMKVFDVIE